MSPLEILKLVGFATGAALHLYMCWLLARRRGMRAVERVLLGLGLSVGAWHLGNFAAVIYELLDVPGMLWWLKSAYELAYLALALMPPLLLHAHLRLWELADERAPRRFFAPALWLNYLPLAALPWVAAQLWREPYLPPVERLAKLLLPFILWFVLVMWESAGIDLWIARKLRSARERRFFEMLGAVLFSIGALFLLTYVFGARQWGTIGRYLETATMLGSLVPTAILAYYIYRYRYLELVIRQSFVYAAFAVVVLMIYLYGIRRLSLALEARYRWREGIIEAILILGLMFLAGPLRRFTERYIQRLFVREVGLYRELVAQVGAAAASYGELAHFIAFVERRLSEALELSRAQIIPRAQASDEARELCRLAEAQRWTQIEDAARLKRLEALVCYALWREGRVVGLLVARGLPAELTIEKREVMAVLAGHIAVAIENCQLLEEKVKLERELAERERLAALGQLAATIAHEVKNPLSSIKSIAQVMREDETVSGEYGRDLDLIAGEVDRLSRSVSQLLSFSRPAAVASSSAHLREIVDGVLALARAEIDERGAQISLRLTADPLLDGETAAALKEVLANLVLNAAQAIERGGSITIESSAAGDGKLRVAVVDDGLGIPPAMQERVFEPFFTTKQRGTGLGLAIIARRVRELEGTMTLYSPARDGRGTRFELTLPVETSHTELPVSSSTYNPEPAAQNSTLKT
jgi:signal transduction histidine kinase